MKTCKNCGCILANQKNTFCSSKCSATYNNNFSHWRYTKKEKPSKTCEYCGEKLKGRNKYCNRVCMGLGMKKKTLESYTTSGNNVSSYILKNYVISVQGYKCSECNIEEWNNKPITLQLEHKDGNSENNAEDNLCLLCPNCHSQTPTYGAKNKGNGRWKRRQRYKDGKSS